LFQSVMLRVSIVYLYSSHLFQQIPLTIDSAPSGLFIVKNLLHHRITCSSLFSDSWLVIAGLVWLPLFCTEFPWPLSPEFAAYPDDIWLQLEQLKGLAIWACPFISCELWPELLYLHLIAAFRAWTLPPQGLHLDPWLGSFMTYGIQVLFYSILGPLFWNGPEFKLTAALAPQVMTSKAPTRKL
jgi:hypothetical protein